MRSLLAFVGGALVTFLVLGWYLNWYTISKETGETPGHARIHFDVNTKKVTDDVNRGIKAGTQKVEQVVEKLPQPSR